MLKSYLRQTDHYLFLLSIVILPISIKWSSKILFFSILLALIKSFYKRDFNWFLDKKPLVFIYSIFIVYIIVQGLIIDGPTILFKTFDRYYAPHLIFILLPVFYAKERIVELVPKALLIGIGFLFLLIFLSSIIDLQLYNRENVLETFDMHHLYISLYVLWAINFVLSRSKTLGHKKFLVFLTVLLLSLLFFKSKSAILVAMLLILYHTLLRFKLTALKLVIIASFLILIVVVFNTFFYNIYLDALDFRSRIWSAALESISKRPLFGYGSANEQVVLNKQHFIEGNYDFLDSNLNSHNQLISFLLKYGAVGCVLALLPFMYLASKARSKSGLEYYGALMILVAMGFIESIYNRHHGIVFCCIILYYYYCKITKDKNQKS